MAKPGSRCRIGRLRAEVGTVNYGEQPGTGHNQDGVHVIVGEESANVANRTVLMTEFRVLHHHVSDGFHAVRVRLGDQRYGHGSFFSVVMS